MTEHGPSPRQLDGRGSRDFRVVVLNGGSSSGKSSIARRLQELLPGIWLTFGVDTFIDSLPGRGGHPSAGISFHEDGSITFTDDHREAERSWYRGLNAMASAGVNIILDEVLLSGEAGQERMRAVFSDQGVVWIGVQCAPEVAAAREAQRPDRVEGMARQQALRVHEGVRYDLQVDTSHRTSNECASEVAAYLHGRTLIDEDQTPRVQSSDARARAEGGSL